MFWRAIRPVENALNDFLRFFFWKITGEPLYFTQFFYQDPLFCFYLHFDFIYDLTFKRTIAGENYASLWALSGRLLFFFQIYIGIRSILLIAIRKKIPSRIPDPGSSNKYKYLVPFFSILLLTIAEIYIKRINCISPL